MDQPLDRAGRAERRGGDHDRRAPVGERGRPTGRRLVRGRRRECADHRSAGIAVCPVRQRGGRRVLRAIGAGPGGPGLRGDRHPVKPDRRLAQVGSTTVRHGDGRVGHGRSRRTWSHHRRGARALERYITTGQGDPAKLLAGLYFWTWNTQEVLDFIQWMRTYNVRAGTPRIRFFGFDMQFPHQALDSLPAMLGRVSASAQAQGAVAVRCFDGVRDGARRLNSAPYAALPVAQQESCAAGLAALADTARASRRVERAAWRGCRVARAVHHPGPAVEHMARTTDATQLFNRRDRAMADNVLWIAGRDPQARLFAWAHNGHVSRRPNTMGRHLANALGDQYRNVAFTFGNGRFNAVTQLASGAFGQLQVQTINGPDGGFTLEGMLNATLEPHLILDTRKVLSGETGTSVLNRRPVFMRSIGSVYSPTNPLTYYERVLLPQDYDGIIWFVNTRESQLLPFN
ncbi:MAG: erythromycin esterase family protein [Gemmatimonadetes bacterium]|nr:erythromycin esterase family protein [Gemmatimonadota bacterium]